MSRIILHVDQNCFFASVEMISKPELRSVPMAVVGDIEERHGIILAKNQLASEAGVKTAEAIWIAKTKSPELVTVLAHYEDYQFYSYKIRDMFLEYTDQVEPYGLDECWLDITDYVTLRLEANSKGSDSSCNTNRDKLSIWEEARQVADEIRARVRDEYQLTCSVGVSFNKVFAKLGSDYKKPDATTVITPDNFRDIVWPLDAGDLLYVGKKTNEQLKKINITTIGDIANVDREFLVKYLGKHGISMWDYANGLDEEEVKKVDYQHDIKSVGNSTTKSKDLTNRNEVMLTFKSLSGKVATRLRRYKMIGEVVQITIRDENLHIIDRQCVMPHATNNQDEILRHAMMLFDENYSWEKNIRSVGVRVTSLFPEDTKVQMTLDELAADKGSDKDDKLSRTIDELKLKFGEDIFL